MNILENNVDPLNAIIFENRNKNYGAYAIRSEYGNTILKSLGITVLIFAFVSSIAIMLNRTADEEKKLEIDINIAPPIPIKDVIIDVTPPKGPKVSTPPPPHVDVVHNTTAVSTNIVDSTIERNITQTIENTNNNVTNNTNNNPGVGDNNGRNNGDPHTDDNGNGGDAVRNINVVEVMPSFNNLPAFLQKNLRYPEMAKEQNIQGKVYINFVVDEEGKIINATVVKGIGYGCDEEALRVVKLIPKGTPGYMGGKAVKVSFVQAISFKLQ
jgi:periplasmic protein TonB